MRSVIVTHCWLENPLEGYMGKDGKCRRLRRFHHHYNGIHDLIVFDNGSSPETVAKYGINITSLQPHLPRGDMLTYPAVWRVYDQIKRVLEDYEKVIFLATDAYILSQRLIDYIEALDSGWTALWSPKYNFPATEIQVIVRGCKAFEEFDFLGQQPGMPPEELRVPLTHIEKGFIGDRYGEFAEPCPPLAMLDYFTQVSDSEDFDDAAFPVLRRLNGKVTTVGPLAIV